jgi:phage terminase large subunit
MTTRADSAQPAMISHVRAKGIHGLIATDKWQGSVEAGIKYLQNFQKIIIHPRCKNAQDEFRLYSYKVNGAGDPTNVIIDANNHLIDSLRYSLSPLIKDSEPGYFGVTDSTWGY